MKWEQNNAENSLRTELTLISILYSNLYSLRNMLCSRKQLKERLWKPGVINPLTQSDKVSCGVFVLTVCDIVFFKGRNMGKNQFSIILFCINHIIINCICRLWGALQRFNIIPCHF